MGVTIVIVCFAFFFNVYFSNLKGERFVLHPQVAPYCSEMKNLIIYEENYYSFNTLSCLFGNGMGAGRVSCS